MFSYSAFDLFLDDATRVILVNGADGDYINANYINMEIPGSGIINRYIATQGDDTYSLNFINLYY